MRVDNCVLKVLSTAEVSGRNVVLTGQLERKLYENMNKVLEAAGGKWNRKAKAHVFEQDAFERIEQILLTGNIDIPKDEFEYFPTPADIVSRLITESKLVDGMRVLEPSAGQGAIAVAISQATAGVQMDMYELMPTNNQILKDLGLPSSNVNAPIDFLTVQPEPVYDRVIMNPPFSRQADIKHVTHALRFLKPNGGLLVSVMSAGVTFRQNKLTTDFRQLVEERGGVIEKLPEGSFKASGTMVETVIAVIPS